MSQNKTGYIEIENISFGYGKGPDLFNNLSLGLDKDEITVLLGENGSGKTTLAKLVMGMLDPRSGRIMLDGVRVEDLALGEVGMKVGYLFQNPDHQIFGATLIDQLLWSFEFLGEDIDLAKGKAEELISLFGLEGSRDTYPYYLSLGEKRILALASVLMRSPDYLILDEPTSSLDEERAGVLKEVLKSLSERGIGMLIITHDEGLLESLGHRMIRLSGGRVENV